MLYDTVLVPDNALNIALHKACQIPLDSPLTTDALAALTTLNVSGLGIESLEGMEHCINLQYFDCSDNKVIDLVPVAGLVSLIYLNINSNYTMTDSAIQEIASLINLEQLGIGYTQVATFSFAMGMNKLTSITGGYLSSLVSLKGIEGASSLNSLMLSRSSALSDISSLPYLPSLAILDLSYCLEISDLTYISQISSLERLDFMYAELQDIDFVKGLRNLNEVNLGGNFIKDLSPLSTNANLTNIALQDNYINDLTALSELRELSRLYLQENCITSLSPLFNLSNLTICNVQENYLTDVSEAEYLSGRVIDFLFEYNFYINTPAQQAFSTILDNTIGVGEEKYVKFELYYTTDGTSYELMQSTNSNGFSGLNVFSSDDSVLTANGVATYINGITSIDATLTGVSVGGSSLSIIFSYADSPAPVKLPLINGEYSQNINVINS